MKELYLAIKEIILNIPDISDPTQKMFKTVKIDKGQFQRVISNVENEEMGIIFPAVFIHFVNVSYLVSQNHIGEGRGTMRVRFVLDRLNDQEDEFETEIFDYAAIINAAIQDARNTNAQLGERCDLQYFDMPESVSRGLQPCWLDYGVNFRDMSAFTFRDYIKKTIATPAHTNFSDMTEENRDGRVDVIVDIPTQSKMRDEISE